MLPEDWHGYLESMRVVNAEERLAELTASAFPDLKKKSRQDIMKKYRKEAASLIPKKRLSMKEAMEKMRHGRR